MQAKRVVVVAVLDVVGEDVEVVEVGAGARRERRDVVAVGVGDALGCNGRVLAHVDAYAVERVEEAGALADGLLV